MKQLSTMLFIRKKRCQQIIIGSLILATLTSALFVALKVFIVGIRTVSKKIADVNIHLLHHYKEMPRIEIAFLRTPKCVPYMGRRVDLVIFIYTKPNDFPYRTTIRETWASETMMGLFKFIVIFPLGQSNNSMIETKIANESKYHNDILQGNFIDSYYNLTYKGLMMLKWFNFNCRKSKHLIKMDSDVYPNIMSIHDFFEKRKLKKRIVSCKMNWRSVVLRPEVWCGKWCVPADDYIQSHYPPYCSGSFYTISANLVRELYNISAVIPLWWVADVHITGHLLLKLKNVQRALLSDFMEYDTNILLKRLRDTPEFLIYGYINSVNLTENIHRAWDILRHSKNITLLD